MRATLMPDHQINPLATGLPAGEASAPFVVPDACTVFRDALSFTPWTDEGGSLPQRGDWSTYRLASKDIILGVVTLDSTQPRRRWMCGRTSVASTQSSRSLNRLARSS